jgi:hypothetical protein
VQYLHDNHHFYLSDDIGETDRALEELRACGGIAEEQCDAEPRGRAAAEDPTTHVMLGDMDAFDMDVGEAVETVIRQMEGESISVTAPNLDCLALPSLFPSGQNGVSSRGGLSTSEYITSRIKSTWLLWQRDAGFVFLGPQRLQP